ncbi:FxSxx-COOH system tetratricopeptide repeat protein [Streptomyces sp. JH34]|uniref:FxSxx-COOH system tetratricopeptide repeat protein n=1 Tax=Streptomyces sp. JH34 TaxID=2793633 RepID=UPI0023F621AB|nr:FxSxx-COOH system tetratricopeptide repeat protein [Streptomyces sp. JH34]MDF6020951.1 FxSxx-COOH system tetratricopeptide repeat protein [Streptomyces sp. JH34]
MDATGPDSTDAAYTVGNGGNNDFGAGPTSAVQSVVDSGAVTATGGGTAVSGIYNDNSTVVLPPEILRAAAETNAPAGMDNVPFRTNHFVGRAAHMDRLDAAMSTPGATPVQVVHGLGGVGKSTLAAHWAATRPHGRTPVRWITADSPASVQQGLVALATALQPALAKALTAEALAEFALQWLASHTGWLVVLDNVHRPADIAPLLARAPAGQFLITSRLASGWHGTAIPTRLDVTTPDESRRLLITRIGSYDGDNPDLDGVDELCAELGHLPLALEQVGSYIAEAGLTPRAYLGLLADSPADMYREGEEGRAVERTIARIWRITLDHLADTPLAGRVLRTLAWYAPDQIPRSLLNHLGTLPAVHSAVRRLAAYSMITVTPDTVTVHRLVQALACTPDSDDLHRQPHDIAQALDDATTGLAAAEMDNGDNPTTWPAWRALLPHIGAIVDRAPPNTDTETTAVVLNQAGLFLAEQGFIARATAYSQRALRARERVLPEDHPHTLTSRNNLAGSYHAVGDLGRAIPLYEQTLKARERVLPGDHPHTLASRNNLAGAYRDAGDLDRAIPLYEETLVARERLLPDGHVDTLTSRNNLASAYHAAGDRERSTPLYEQTLADSERLLPDGHPLTLTVRNNLAGAYRDAGDLDRAIPLYEETLVARERLLPDSHLDTLASRNHLARAHHVAGNLEKAIPLYEQTLAALERGLPDGLDTLALRVKLADAYQEAGELERALPLYERAMTDAKRLLSDGHPDRC